VIDAAQLPKAELHIHIEGALEPEQIFEFAERNRIELPYADEDELRRAYRFENLQSFLNLYYAGMSVLRTERDFEDLALAYFKRAQQQNIKHAEMFFDPQAHVQRGIRFEAALDGLWSAMRRSEREFGLSTQLIMCFLRDLPEASASEMLDLALRFQDRIAGVGLDSAEAGNPPDKFQAVYDRARANGFRAVAHAGEEGPPEYVWQALDILKVSRIDHGVRALEDEKLVRRLVESRTPLTVCPLSNVRLHVVSSLEQHPLKRMLDAGLLVTVNSDDPAYFGGYVNENYVQTAEALKLSDADVVQLAKNSFEASFIDAPGKAALTALVDTVASGAA